MIPNSMVGQVYPSLLTTLALALVQGYVTVIGGMNVISSLASNVLYSFDEEETKKWCQKFPAMLTK